MTGVKVEHQKKSYKRLKKKQAGLANTIDMAMGKSDIHKLKQSRPGQDWDNTSSTLSGWWLGHPSEKYEFVNYDD